MLRRLGLSRKLPLGRPYEVAFRTLRAMRRIRGTPLDPFGWDHDRRTERALVEEYERIVRQIAAPAAPIPYETRVRVAESVLSIKGYGPIKEAAVARWREEISSVWPAAHAGAAAAGA